MRTLSANERWRTEMTAAYLLRAAARREKDARLKALFDRMAVEGEAQAAIIAKDVDNALLQFSPSLRARLIAAAVGLLGPRAARPLLVAAKVRGLSVYNGTETVAAAAGHAMPTDVAAIGKRHGGGRGGSLRAAVFGVNDGLVSNMSLVMGVAGASAAGDVILVAGVAGLLAGAFSMAAGEYVSMRTQREMFEHQIAQEKAELDLYPEEEAEELALIYEARGVPIEEARNLARRLVADPKVALDALAREELGLNPDDLGSASAAALFSFLAFAAGAFVPLLPFLLGLGERALPVAAVLSAVALFAIGAVMSFFSGRSALLGGARMLFIGALAGAATFGIGRFFGVATA
ncbi:MAG: VIT1/CCC1 transporter family protein [Parvularculaceae bacterium]|nr:VIT1/CCC1 transporter family protein [Parvularculaceae bacterium]